MGINSFVCVWSYHFWRHPGNQIMDGLSKDAQGGEDEHNPEYDTGAAGRQTDREQMLGGCFRKLQKLQKVWSLSWGSYVKLNQSNNSKTRFLKQHNHSVWQMSEDCLQSIWGTVCYQNKQFADFRKGILGWHFDICLLKKISGIMRRMFVCVGGGGWAAYAHSLALAAME